MPRDLHNGGRAPAVNGTTYTVTLPRYDFTMLDVKTPSAMGQ
ncbi:hypothetical protein ABUW04_32955 [Streptacidiphilus sp. N1-10]|uniref:Uncharacterized protein n=1 Tax=Streptacidiphilus jeojiensis TaxID=3229225 RepID=A0ABV6XYP4_9ACTN